MSDHDQPTSLPPQPPIAHRWDNTPGDRRCLDCEQLESRAGGLCPNRPPVSRRTRLSVRRAPFRWFTR